MSQPRDHNSEATVGGIRTARIFSNVISPPVIFACLGLALAWTEEGFWPGLLWAAIYGFWVSLMPILLVVYLLKTNRIGDLHMSDTRERRLPYVASVFGALVALVIIQLFNGPELLRCLSIYSLLSLTSLALITIFWLISIHATSIAGATVIVTLVYGPLAGLFMGFWVILVSYVRLFLRRHTISQVAVGLALGVLIVLLLAQLGCFR